MLGRILLLLLVAGSAAASDAPAPAVINSTNSPAGFALQRGFKVDLVAADPLVANPIAMAFDQDGRLFVLETAEVSAGGAVGRLRLLEDTAGNGLFDTSVQYADNLASPAALACYGSGVFVSSAGAIIYLKDTKGDGAADVRQEVFKTFGEQTNGSAGQVAITSLAWGLDNRIHAATASRGGDVVSGSSPPQSIILTNGNFSFDPRSLKLSAESGSGASGMSFDNRGREFVSDPSRHVQMVMYDARYAGRNPFYQMPGALLDLAGAGPAGWIYPARLPSAAAVPVRFTSANSIVIYRGYAFGADYLDDAFTVDAVANVLHRDKLRPTDVELVAERPADEATAEFLAVRDNSFQLNLAVNAPDGTLYIAGVLREGARPGAPARGRIYRVAPLNFKPAKPARLSEATGDQLALTLRHSGGWQRDTAARLLFERQDKSTVAPVVRLLFDKQAPPLARMTALQVLDGLQFTTLGRPGKALAEPHVLRALFDPDDRVREHGVRLAERFMPGGNVSDPLWGQLSSMTGDPSPQVRYQLAFTLGQARHEGRVQALADLLRGDVNSPWMRAALLSSLNDGAGEMLALLAGDANVRGAAGGDEFLRQLTTIIGMKNQPAEAARALADIQRLPEPQLAFGLARALDNGLQRGDRWLAALDNDGILSALQTRAAKVALDDSADDSARALALQLLSATSSADPGLTGGLIWGWSSRRPGFRAAALVALLSRPDRTQLMIQAVGNGVIPQSDFTSTQIRFLLAYPDPNLRQQAAFLLTAGNASQRQAAVNRFLPALEVAGQAARGRQIFLAHCAACHQFDGVGNPAGLAIAGAPATARQSLLVKILDPNRDTTPNYAETLVTTRDGETLTGFLTDQTPKSITLCQDNGAERVVARSKIQSQGNLGFSAMPEGLETVLSLQDMADLLEYLTTIP